MSDLIRRDDAIYKFSHLDMQVYEGSTCVGIRTCLTKEEIIYAIDDIPTAEPERKNGKWSNYKDEHCCSVCKCVVISDCWNDEIRYDYCPYCGADMRGE